MELVQPPLQVCSSFLQLVVSKQGRERGQVLVLVKREDTMNKTIGCAKMRITD